jgi:AcrR family transcriptional regulator
MTPQVATARRLQTADERRSSLLDAAQRHFAQRGYWGTPTAEVAKAAGISQAYLFRLFPTKEELFIACAERCFEHVHEAFRRAAAPHAGDPDAMFEAMAMTYAELLQDRDMLLSQLQSYAACDAPAIRASVQRHYGRLVDLVRETTGAPDERIGQFFATGMLLTVVAAMGADQLDEPWTRTLMAVKTHDC